MNRQNGLEEADRGTVLPLHLSGTQTDSNIGQAGRCSARDCNWTLIKYTWNLNNVNLKSDFIALNNFAPFVMFEYFNM